MKACDSTCDRAHTEAYMVGWLSKVLCPTRHIFGHFRDGDVTTASARIIDAASAEASSPAQPHSVCGVE